MPRRPARGDRGALRLDPRLLIGILLVAGSATGVWVLVSGLDDSSDAYVTRGILTPGTRIESDDLTLASVRLGTSSGRYLAPGDIPAGGLVITRTVGDGEFVPASSVDDADRMGLATVVVPSRRALPSTLSTGAAVDVWAARELDRGTFEPPAVLVGGAEIAGIQEPEGMVGSGGVSVELLVPRERVAALLQALAAGDAIDLVPSRVSGD